jgi:glycosyltransferase involved in cell wall biosynthesis
MHVLIVTCVFPPEPLTSARTSADLAAGLVAAGHQVTVIGPYPSRPPGAFRDGQHQFANSKRCVQDGYHVIRAASLCAPGQSIIGKLFENVTFGITSSLAAGAQKADVIFANTWPIFAGGMTSLVSRARRLPLVLSVQDIHPEAAGAIGRLVPQGIGYQALQRIDRSVARSATALVTISAKFAEFYRDVRGVPEARIHIISNWMDDEKVFPCPRTGEWRRKLNISDEDFVVMYAGNIGGVAGVESLVDAADCLRNERGIVFVFAGDGSRRRACEQSAMSRRLPNTRFLSPLPDEQFCDVQGIADLLMLPTRSAGAITSVPSKLIAYMLSARPVLAMVDESSETARVIRAADCGTCVPPDSCQSLTEEIRRQKDRRSELISMGLRGRQYAQANFSRRACVPKLIRLLESVAKDGRFSKSGKQEGVPWKKSA